MTGGATEHIRQELGGLAPDGRLVPAELGALLRGAGTLAKRDGAWSVEVLTPTGAVARRAHVLLRSVGVEPTVFVREATNVARRTYGVVVPSSSTPQLGRLVGLLDDAGRPRPTAPDAHLAHPAALVRGALLGGGSVSAPHRPPHLELRTTRVATAEQLADVVASIVATRPSVGPTRGGSRAVLKSADAITRLLEAAGARRAAEARAELAQRRRMRADAQRLANADAANVARAVAAAGEQVELVERAVAEVGWDGLAEDLRDVALARLANPSASLTEVGRLCDPPIGKSAVHRRLGRLRDLLAR